MLMYVTQLSTCHVYHKPRFHVMVLELQCRPVYIAPKEGRQTSTDGLLSGIYVPRIARVTQN